MSMKSDTSISLRMKGRKKIEHLAFKGVLVAFPVPSKLISIGFCILLFYFLEWRNFVMELLLERSVMEAAEILCATRLVAFLSGFRTLPPPPPI